MQIFDRTPFLQKKEIRGARDGVVTQEVDKVGEQRDAGREKSEGESKRGCSASPVDRKYVTRALVSHGVFFFRLFLAERRGVRTFSLLSLLSSLSLVSWSLGLFISSLFTPRSLERGGLWCRVYGVGFMV